MNIRSRTLAMFAAAALTLSSAAAFAQPPAGRRPGPGPDGPLPLRQLNLTDAQRDQIKAITDQARTEDQTAAFRQLRELRRSLQQAVLADTPDTAKIDQLRTQIAEAETAALAARIDLQLKVAQVLTPEQRKQALTLIDQRPQRPRASARK